MENTNAKLSAALAYADLGYKVFPCAANAKTPLTKRGFLDASTDPSTIETWWTKYPDANIGIPTAGLFVVDVDGADNPWPASDIQAEDLASCPLSMTPRGGRHYVFRQPDGREWRNPASKPAPNVDTRATGGYIIAPPSSIGGTHYRWAETRGLTCSPADLPTPPDWLEASLRVIGIPGNGHHPAAGPALAEAPIPEGCRNEIGRANV